MNVRTLLPNLDQVKLLLLGNSFDVFALNETRLCDSINDSQLCIDDYVVYRRDRNRRGGGVMIYVNEKRLKHKLRIDLMSNDVELVAIEINQANAAPIIVLAWYRPPALVLNCLSQ